MNDRRTGNGDMRREAEHLEALLGERDALEQEITQSQERLGMMADVEDEYLPTRFRQHCVELRPLRAMWSLLNYAELRETLFDGRRPQVAALYFTHVLVLVKARDLKAIVAGLRMHTQWVIEEYDEAQKGPAPPGCVSGMEFVVHDIPRAVAVFRYGGMPEPRPPGRKRR